MAAARNRALEAIQRALKRQSLGGREGRFAVNRTLEHLRRCNIMIGEDIKAISINLADTEKLNYDYAYGTKRFLYENVPQLKYKNPHVEFSRNKTKTTEAELRIHFADGREEQILTLEKSPSQIVEELINLTKTEQTLIEEQSETELKA